MEPVSGTRSPEMHSTMVVLPAPLGPMIPKISPFFIEKEKLLTAIAPFACYLTVVASMEFETKSWNYRPSLPESPSHRAAEFI